MLTLFTDKENVGIAQAGGLKKVQQHAPAQIKKGTSQATKGSAGTSRVFGNDITNKQVNKSRLDNKSNLKQAQPVKSKEAISCTPAPVQAKIIDVVDYDIEKANKIRSSDKRKKIEAKVDGLVEAHRKNKTFVAGFGNGPALTDEDDELFMAKLKDDCKCKEASKSSLVAESPALDYGYSYSSLGLDDLI